MDITGRKILVMHEDPQWGMLFRMMLSDYCGDQVKFADDGEEGLLHAEQDPPDLIFIYLSTPGLNAVEFTRRLKANPALKHIPVVVYGALLPDKAYGPIKLAGADGYLLQPFGADALAQARDAALNHLLYYP